MKENTYSIKDLENLTNIKAHTIRIWEQRYKLLNPKRTDTNIRYYEDDDLKKLLNVNLLYNNGLKISKIAKLSESEIIEEAKVVLQEQTKDTRTEVDALLMGILDLDGIKIQNSLSSAYESMGISEMYTEIIIPMLHKVGDLWQLNTISVGHEHFFSNILREFLLAKTNELPSPKENSKRAILFLHADEQHELSLLFYHYMFRAAGWTCAYLGQNVPTADLKITVQQFQPDLCLTCFIKHLTSDKFTDTLNEILEVIPKEKLVVSGSQTIIHKNLIPSETQTIRSSEDLKKHFV